MIYKSQFQNAESPLAYFDAIFYVYQKHSESIVLKFITENLETNYVMLNIEMIKDKSGEPDLIKTKQVILSKAKRHAFEKVLVIREFPEELSDALIPHLKPIVHHMKTEDWIYWRIEMLTENRLQSSFSDEFCENPETCFSIAFNTKKLPVNFFG